MTVLNNEEAGPLLLAVAATCDVQRGYPEGITDGGVCAVESCAREMQPPGGRGRATGGGGAGTPPPLVGSTAAAGRLDMPFHE